MSCGPNCTCTIFHQDILNKVESNIISKVEIERSADFFKILANPTRIKIIEAVNINELCVCDLAHLLGITKSAISHQVKILRKANIVTATRKGKMVYYKVKESYASQFINKINNHLGEKNNA